MSFSFDDEDGVAIALKKMDAQQLQKKNQILYFTSELDREEITEADISDDALVSIFGKFALRSKMARERKRKEVLEKIKGSAVMNINDYMITDKAKFKVIPYSISYTGADRPRDVFFLSGQAGSGKSYQAKELLKMYRKMKTHKVLVFTDVKDDEFGKVNYLDIDDFVGVNASMSKAKADYEEARIRFKHKKKKFKDDPDTIMELELELNRMKPDTSDKTKRMGLLLDETQMAKLFTDAVVLFDDYENNEKADKILFLMDNLLTKGRHTHTDMIICNHLTNDGMKFRLIHKEATNYFLFNKTDFRSLSYFSRDYLGLSPDALRRVRLALKKSRWICIDKVERFAITEKEVFMLN